MEIKKTKKLINGGINKGLKDQKRLTHRACMVVVTWGYA